MSVPKRLDCFILFVKYKVIKSPEDIHANIKGIPIAPSFTASIKLRRKPNNIIPALKAYLTEKAIPFLNTSLKLIVFRIIIPTIIRSEERRVGKECKSKRTNED